MPAGDVVVYAKWAPIQYTVRFELNGGTDTGSYGDQILDPNEAAQEPADPTRDGFRFGGWVTEEGLPYDFHQGVTRDITLYAKWISVDSYTVAYLPGEGAGGSVPVDGNKYALEADAQVLSPEDLTPPEGKVFLGWQVQGSGEMVQPGGRIEITGNMTLVAQWGEVPGKTQVTYALNGGNYNGNTADVVVPADINGQLIVKEAPVRPGYEFTGWQIKGTGEVVQPGSTIQVDNENEENNILIAQWKESNADLTITKNVAVLGSAGQSVSAAEEDFTINVTVNGSAYSGSYTVGGDTFSTSNGVIILAAGESAVISLRIGSEYSVQEQDGSVDGYIYDTTAKTGEMDADGESVTINNKFFKTVTTSVAGTKTWSGSAMPEGAAEITLYADGVEYSVEPTWSGNTYTFSNLPKYKLVGETVQEIVYTVAETGVTVNSPGNANLKVTKDGSGRFIVYDESVPAKENGVVNYKVLGYWDSEQTGNNFTNTWTPAQDQYQGTYGFQIAKVDGSGEAVTGVTATFTVTKDGTKVGDFVTDAQTGIASVIGLEAGTYVIEETGVPAGYVGADGTWEITISENGYPLQRVSYNQSGNFFVNLWNRLFGTSQEDSTDYAWSVKEGAGTLTVTNEKIMGTIQVTKEIPDGLTASGSFTFDVKDSTGTTVDTLTMAAGESDTTIALPYGTYTIVETGTAAITDYTWSGVTYKVNGAEAASFTIDEQGETIAVTAANAYTRDTGALEITKRIPAGDWSAVTGAESYSGTISYSGAASGNVTFRKSDFGSAPVDGYYVKTWIIKDVPTGDYTIAETGAGIDHYDLSKDIDEASVTVEKGETASVTVTNDYTIHTHDLSIEKIVAKTDTSVDAPEEDFTFTVKLGSGSVTVPDEQYTGSSAPYVENGSYTFTLSDEETAVITGVPYGVSYEVEETNIPEGFLSSWTDNKAAGTIGDAGNVTLTCTNTYFKSPVVSIQAEKDWSNTPEAYRRAVTVELYKDGAATGETVTLNEANGWSASFDNLPLYDGRGDTSANVYSVQEKTVDGKEPDGSRFILYNEAVTATDPDGDSASDYEILGFWTSSAAEASAKSSDAVKVWKVTNTWQDAADGGDVDLTIEKRDADTNALMDGVTFTLKGEGYDSSVATGSGSNAEGRIVFTGLRQGTYTLTETLPAGYAAGDGKTSWTITVGRRRRQP